MISVIIPALNEASNIASVVAFARRSPCVSEVIVIDDGSIDGTPDLARDAGAVVVTSTLLGKGMSMEDGLFVSRSELLLYLDGDLSGLRDDLIERMTAPLIDGSADFVKARFTRDAGRVTTLTARPLLQTFFPELSHIEQPLGGIIAVRKPLLRNLKFETDYGVDVGILLDAVAVGARVVQVDIGHIEHDSQPLHVLGEMARQVTRTILNRAARYGRLSSGQIREVEEVERHEQSELIRVLGETSNVERMALFDMDGVLVRGRFIVNLAQRVNRGSDLQTLLDNPRYSSEERTRRIASLFKGVPKDVFEQVARSMPLMEGAVETIVGLRKAGFRVGIVTDSYRVVAEILRRRVFADFSVAHLMRFRNGTATGEVTIAPTTYHSEGCPDHPSCKQNVLQHILERTGLAAGQVLAVGDTVNDACLLRAAGTGIAFQPKSDEVTAAACHVVEGPLTGILQFVVPDRPARATA